MPSKALWHAELALLPSGVVPRVLIEVEGERISALTPDTDPPPSASRLPGFTLPGLANAHSHAFHRALRGRTQRERGDFWSWRRRMYELAGRLDPESYLALATAVYAEMTLAGVTAVGEFHYIHHDQEGRRYADPNEMGLALAAAASKAGIRLTLIDACYLRGDLKGRPLEGPQLRFGDGDASTWAERVGKLQAGPTLRIAAGIHSVRALHPGAMRQVAAWAPPARPSACARPPSATWPTASAPPRRWPPPAARCASAATATPSSTCSRSPAPWSWTSAWPRAAAATTARPRCSPPPRLAAWRRSAGATPAASRPATWPTSPPSTWARRGWRAPAPKTSSTTWCSPPPPPTSPTS